MKKLNLAVAILVAVALTLLFVLLVTTFFKGDDDSAEPSPSPSADTTPISTPDGGDLETADIDDVPDDEPEASPDETAEPLTGDRQTLKAYIAQEKLTITYDSANFTHDAMQDGDMYYLSSDSTRGTFLEVVVFDGDLADRKAGFIDAYIPDYTSIDMLGMVVIGSSMVVGEGITATNGSTTVEAWLIEVEGGFFAVTAGYENEDGRRLIYRMLDTLTFEM